jgi:ATP-dependent DNA helicase RecG
MTNLDLQQLIAQGEGYYIEFKKDLNTDFKKELMAFANASGGTILLGVDDNGKIVGTKSGNDFRSQIQQHASECDPAIDICMKLTR